MLIKPLQQLAYEPCLEAMRQFTAERNATTPDEIWLVEHPAVFTFGLAGKPEHLLDAGEIPVQRTERGGQVTYHGPGQLIAYILFDLKRARITVKGLVCLLEKSAINYFSTLGIQTCLRIGAPGVYIKTSSGEAGAKIAALGLKVSRGCSYHGIALNIHMNLEPFTRINPCGYAGLAVTDVYSALGQAPSLHLAGERFAACVQEQFALESRA